MSDAATEDAGEAMNARMRRDLRDAMKRGDKAETSVLCELVAELDNAEIAVLRRYLQGKGREARPVALPSSLSPVP
jgi:hypothetical protein